MRATVPIVLAAALLAETVMARAAAAGDRADAGTLDGLYDRIAADLVGGKPLVVAAFCGLWFDRQDEPERNLMAVGGYITLSLADSLARGRDADALVEHVNDTYQAIHRRHKPGKRIGRPHIGHADVVAYEAARAAERP